MDQIVANLKYVLLLKPVGMVVQSFWEGSPYNTLVKQHFFLN